MSLHPYSTAHAVHADLEMVARSRGRLQQILEQTRSHLPDEVGQALSAAIALYETALEVRTWAPALADTWGRLVLGGMDHRVAMQTAKDINTPEET